MTQETYTDGFANIVVTGTIVRVDLMALVGADADGKPRFETRGRLMHEASQTRPGAEALRLTREQYGWLDATADREAFVRRAVALSGFFGRSKPTPVGLDWANRYCTSAMWNAPNGKFLPSWGLIGLAARRLAQ